MENEEKEKLKLYSDKVKNSSEEHFTQYYTWSFYKPKFYQVQPQHFLVIRYYKHKDEQNFSIIFELLRIKDDRLQKADVKILYFNFAYISVVYHDKQSGFYSIHIVDGDGDQPYFDQTILKYLFSYNPPVLTEKSNELMPATIARDRSKRFLDDRNWEVAQEILV